MGEYGKNRERKGEYREFGRVWMEGNWVIFGRSRSWVKYGRSGKMRGKN